MNSLNWKNTSSYSVSQEEILAIKESDKSGICKGEKEQKLKELFMQYIFLLVMRLQFLVFLREKMILKISKNFMKATKNNYSIDSLINFKNSVFPLISVTDIIGISSTLTFLYSFSNSSNLLPNVNAIT